MKIRKLTKVSEGNEVEERGLMIVKAHIILTLKKLRLLLLKILPRRPLTPSAARPPRAPPSLNPARVAIPELPQMERVNFSNRHQPMPEPQKVSFKHPLPPLMKICTQQNHLKTGRPEVVPYLYPL